MERAAKFAFVKSTFLHVHVDAESSGGEEEVWSLPSCRSGNCLRRASSQPSPRGGSNSVRSLGSRPASPLYVDDGSHAGWRKMPSGAEEVLLEVDSPNLSSPRLPASPGCPVVHCRSGSDLSTASSDAFGTAWMATLPPSPGAETTSDHELTDQHPEAACRSDEEALQWTTVMMRNLPNTYSRDQLRQLIDREGFLGRYDFVYLPTDFKTHAGLGFAFVNMLVPQDAELFRQHFSGFKSWGVPTGKVCNVSWASRDQQGLQANIERYRNSSVMHKSVAEHCKPMVLAAGVPTKFPKNTKRLWPPNANFGVRANRAAK